MAQVKKLQSGGSSPITTSPQSKKRIYNGVELTDDDINNIISKVGEWGAKSSNYSEDIRKWGELGEQVKSQMLQGIMPEFSTTGTGMNLGDINVSEGKTNQNIFGNWAGEKLNRQYTSKLKEALDQYVTPQVSSESQASNPNTNQNKIHKHFSGLLSNKYFGGNSENALKGINEWDINTRKNRLREALIDSLNEYKLTYNEDSPYVSKLKDLNDSNISLEKLKEIANSMGMDVSDYLSESTIDTNSNDPYSTLRTHGDIIEDDFLTSQGFVALKDKLGKVRLFDKNDLTKEILGQHGTGQVVTDWGKYYGKGLFYDQNTGWKWGNKTDLAQGDLYNPVNQYYKNIYNESQKSIVPETIDFNTTYNPVLSGLRDKKLNTLDYFDISNQFGELGENRIFVPKNSVKYDDLGNIDLKQSKLYYFNKKDNILSPIQIYLNISGPSYAKSIGSKNFGTVFNLGSFGKGFGTNEGLNKTYSIELGQPSNIDDRTFKNSISRVKGFSANLINKENIIDFYNKILNKNFTVDLDPNEAINLYNSILKIYNNPNYKVNLSQESISKLQKVLDELKSGNPVKTNKFINTNQIPITSNIAVRKKGGILKYQAGGGIKSDPIKLKKIEKVQSPKSKSYSVRMSDDFSTSDKLDLISTGLDAASLAGGAIGVGAGLASTLVQAVSDTNRSGFMSGEMLKNLGVNLGFTALAFIPGVSAVKVGKIAKQANRLKNATKFIKDTEKAVKVLSKVEDLSDDAKKALKAVNMAKKVIADAEKGKDVTKFINKVTLNPFVKGAATTARVGFSTLGVTNGINSGKNIIEDINTGGINETKLEDWRGLVGGVAGVRATAGMTKNALIRKGTEPIKSLEKVKTEIKEGASKWSKTKTKASDFKQNVSKKSNNYVKNKLTDTWQDRKLKSEEGANWLTRQGIKQAKNAGFTKDGLTRDVNQKLIDVLNNESKLTSKPKLALPEYKPNVVSKPISGKYPVADEPYNPVKAFQESVNNLLKNNSNIKNVSINNKKTNTKKSSKVTKKRIESLNKKGLIEKDGQLKMFKQGGKLIPKFQNSGKLNWTLQNNDKNYFKQPTYLDKLYQTQNSNLKNKLEQIWNPNSPIYISSSTVNNNGEIISGEVISGEKINTYGDKLRFPKNNPITNSIQTPPVNQTKKFNDVPLKELQKRTVDVDFSLLKELPKLSHTLLGNRKNAQILSRVSPVLMQTPGEIYKPVVTNLANENFVNNQVNSYLHQSSKPMTSDASLQKGIQLETISKTIPMLIQAKAVNTDTYNQSLGLSRDNSEKYAAIRNEIANSNRERIGAHQARLANIEAGKNVADVASFSNFYDKANEISDRNAIYKSQADSEKEMQNLQSEFSNKLKPFEEAYNKLTDEKQSDTYKQFEELKKSSGNITMDLNSNYGRTDGKTWSQAIQEEKENKYRQWMNKRDELTPYYQSQFLNIKTRNPYLTNFSIGSYKSGGELSAKSKVEVQQLKNKLKEKELDSKYRDKALDRKQKEVSSILNGLSKETFFLLKTLLGK